MRRSQWSMNLKNCYDRSMQMKNHLSPLCAALSVPINGWFGGVSGLTGLIFQISNWAALNEVGADGAVSAATEFARLSQAGFQSAGFPCIFQHVSKEWLGFAHFSHCSRPWCSLPLFWGAFGELCMIFGIVTSAGRKWLSEEQSRTVRRWVGRRRSKHGSMLALFVVYLKKHARRLGKSLLPRILPRNSSKFWFKAQQKFENAHFKKIKLLPKSRQGVEVACDRSITLTETME